MEKDDLYITSNYLIENKLTKENLKKEALLKFFKEFYNFNFKELQLTNRQIECLSLLQQGKTYKQIAKDLNISQRTVEHHMELLKVKTNKRFKTELIDFAVNYNKFSNFLKN